MMRNVEGRGELCLSNIIFHITVCYLTLDELKFQQLLLLRAFIKQVCPIIPAMDSVNFTHTQQPSGFENVA
jgi:hypothetical protein